MPMISFLFPGKKIGPDFGCDPYPGPILESKDMHAIFQKKGKKTWKNGGGKIFENLSKNVQNLKIFWKRAGDCMQLSHEINCYKRPCIPDSVSV